MDAADLLAAVTALSLSEAAGLFAAAGVPVFPCVAGGKRPLTEHGFHDATTELRRVQAWWVHRPGANIGIPTGVTSGIEVVDVDVHAAGSGFASFERARRAGLVNGWEALVRTPSHGIHAYYPADPAQPQASWQAANAHIDFRGTGGYIIAPPSRITARDDLRVGYAPIAIANTPPTPVDAVALRDFLDPRPTPTPRPSRFSHDAPDAERLAMWVAGRGEGERNRGLFWAACRLAETGVTPGETQTALGPAAVHAGLPAAEVTATIRSAYRSAQPHSSALGPGFDQARQGGELRPVVGRSLA